MIVLSQICLPNTDTFLNESFSYLIEQPNLYNIFVGFPCGIGGNLMKLDLIWNFQEQTFIYTVEGKYTCFSVRCSKMEISKLCQYPVWKALHLNKLLIGEKILTKKVSGKTPGYIWHWILLKSQQTRTYCFLGSWKWVLLTFLCCLMNAPASIHTFVQWNMPNSELKCHMPKILS